MRQVLDHPEMIDQKGEIARRRALDLFTEGRMITEHFDLYCNSRHYSILDRRQASMTSAESLRVRFAEHYWVWKAYHLLVADAVSIQRPTKFRVVRKFLNGNFGRSADIGCGPGVFTKDLCSRATERCSRLISTEHY